jgi:3-dehydroquinate dehydratase
MNNEEKILTILETLTEKIDKLETRFDGLETRFDGLETRFNGLEAVQKEMRDDLEFVRITATRMEIEHGREIRALHDGFTLNKEILDRHTAALERIENRLDHVEVVQLVHTDKLKKAAI